MLRIAIQGGGCSGFQYALGFDRGAQAGDHELEFHGVTVVVDPFSAPYLQGSTIDFLEAPGVGLQDRQPERGLVVRLRPLSFQVRGRGAGGCRRRRLRLRLLLTQPSLLPRLTAERGSIGARDAISRSSLRRAYLVKLLPASVADVGRGSSASSSVALGGSPRKSTSVPEDEDVARASRRVPRGNRHRALVGPLAVAPARRGRCATRQPHAARRPAGVANRSCRRSRRFALRIAAEAARLRRARRGRRRRRRRRDGRGDADRDVALRGSRRNVPDFVHAVGLPELGFWGIVLATMLLVSSWFAKIVIRGIVFARRPGSFDV